MATKPKIIIEKSVYEKLSSMIDAMPEDTITGQLVDELERAKIVSSKKLPDDVVTMHSRVTFTVQSTGKTFTYTLVYPTELDNTADQLSVFSPIGSAIIGLQQGQEIDWPISRTQRTIVKVDSVTAPQ